MPVHYSIQWRLKHYFQDLLIWLFFRDTLWQRGVLFHPCSNTVSSAVSRMVEASYSPVCELDGYLCQPSQSNLVLLSLERQQRPFAHTTSPTLLAPGCRYLPSCRTLGNETLPVPYKQVFLQECRWCLFLLWPGPRQQFSLRFLQSALMEQEMIFRRAQLLLVDISLFLLEPKMVEPWRRGWLLGWARESYVIWRTVSCQIKTILQYCQAIILGTLCKLHPFSRNSTIMFNRMYKPKQHFS